MQAEIILSQYLKQIKKQFDSGISTEHSFRGYLKDLIETLTPGILATNEPTHISCGAPDYIITKNKIPLGYIEAKDINADLENKNYKEQFDHYKNSLENLIITDYLTFQFFKEGKFVTSAQIGKIENKKLIPIDENFPHFISLIKDFCSYTGQTIKTAQKLSQMMAGKARLLANIIENALNSDEETTADSSLKAQIKAFKDVLIHDINVKEFSDIYAQTIAYGMFAARLHDPSLESFTRQEAAELIPKSNPFLRKLFGYIAGPDIDERIVWVVNALADIFRATDVFSILKNFGSATQQNDPMIHFYETFLAEYDPKLRKARGVYYTYEAVVNFIVRAVDDILKTEFNLPDGLADRSKIKIKIKEQNKNVEKEVHKVQMLDPTTGTGTFLVEIIKKIYKKFENQKGVWSKYVEEHLIPRLNGFEILMASYAMAHLKLDLLLNETGFKPNKEQRLRVYLTNSLEEHHPDTGTLFANWLSTEANEANYIKRDTPVMVVLGNPPYSGESENKGEWIMNLMEDYKKEPGGKEKLKEKNPKWINDDYVKFLRYGQHFIERNGEGVLAFINNHSFLDNPTFRGMRWNLLKTYDKIYILDLHGNAKKKETAPDGSKDENVFDIMQGVSINIFIKTGKKKFNELGKVFHYGLYGKRDLKYAFLFENSIKTIKYKLLQNIEPNFFFVKKNFEIQGNYEKGFGLNNIFVKNSVGIVTARDEFTIHEKKESLIKTIEEFLSLENEVARLKFKLGKDVRDWKVEFAKKDLNNPGFDLKRIVKISYRPFDERYTYYTGKSKGFLCMPRGEVMQHYTHGDNVGLSLCKQFKTGDTYQHCFISKNIIESSFVSNRTSEITSSMPLYLYSEIKKQKTLDGEQDRTPNLKKEIVEKIASGLSLTFTNEKEKTKNTFAPIDILDYIYAVLNSPTYREKYKEFLKIDFPRVPYPTNKEKFWQLVKLGSELREIHLLESKTVNKFTTSYPEHGTNAVEKIKFDKSKVWINEKQYFDKVPQIAWEFYIGGYQPAQKWLKDRKGRELSFDDIQHYQKIIVALTETNRIMNEIDKIGIE